MPGRRMITVVSAAAPALLLIGPLSGCALSAARFQGTAQKVATEGEPASPRPSSSPNDGKMLAAVEEFLERTRVYQASRAPAPAPRPSQPSARVARWNSADAYNGGVRRGPVGDGIPPGEGHVFANTQVALSNTPSTEVVPALPVVESLVVHEPPEVAVPADQPPKAQTTNEPINAQITTAPSMSVDRFLAYLEERAAEANDFESEWALRLTQLAFHHEPPNAEVSPNLPREAGSLLAALVRAASAVRRALRDPSGDAATALDPVDQLRHQLADRADPVISTVALCRKVLTFGVYEEMDDADFVAGRSSQTIVYSEIQNFRSRKIEDGRYQTELATRLEVLTADGRSVWQHEEPQIVDLCRQRRTDFFVAQRITLPSTLPAGAYVLKVLVEDKLSGKADEVSYPFTIRSTLSAANSG